FSQTAHPKVMSGQTEQKTDEEESPGSLGLSGAETDRYGFLLGNGDAQSLSDEPCPQLVRHREMKWLTLMNQWDQVLEKKNSKIKGQCQKGIPASVRAKCWPLLCGATHRKEKNKNLYETLDSAPGQQSWIDVIKRDTDRQFPFHEMFLNKDGHGQQGLLRVLKAYTQFRPEEGYCQAQGPVAAVLLMNMPMEEAFWCLVQISELYLPGYYSPLLEGVLFDAAILSSVLKRTCPGAYKHLQSQGVEPLMFATDWLMCLYSRHLPFNTLLRVWDLFFCYGVRVLFQVAVVLVRRCLGEARQRKECEGQMETLEQLRGVRARVQHEPTDAFIQEVCSVPLSLGELQRRTEKELQKWRKDRPGSTFDPRARCHGYHMVWEKGREKEKENEKKERQSGNLTVPLMRSHSSLSPAILRKKWRKRGSKADTDEWEGGGRRFSQGVKEDSSDGEQRQSVCSAAGEFRAKTDSMTHETGTQFQKDHNTLTDTHATQHEHLDKWSSSELSEHNAPVFEEDENDPPENMTHTDCGGHDQPSEKDLQTGSCQNENEIQIETCQSQDNIQIHQDTEREETQTQSNEQNKETTSHQGENDDGTQQVELPQTQTSQQEEETHVTRDQHKEETQGNSSDQAEVNNSEQELLVRSTQGEESRMIQEEETEINRSEQEKDIQLNVCKPDVESQVAETEENGNLEEDEMEVNRCKQEQERQTNTNKQEGEIQNEANEQENDIEIYRKKQEEEIDLDSCKQEEEIDLDSCKQEEEIDLDSCKQGEEEIHLDSCKQEEEIHLDSCKQEEEIHIDSCKQGEEIHLDSCKQEEDIHIDSCKQEEEIHLDSCKQEEDIHIDSCKQEEEIHLDSCKQEEEIHLDSCKQEEGIHLDSCKQEEEVHLDSCKQEEEIHIDSCKQEEEIHLDSCKQEEEIHLDSCKQEEEIHIDSCKQEEEIHLDSCKQEEEIHLDSCKQEEDIHIDSCKQEEEIHLDSCKQEVQLDKVKEEEVQLEEVTEDNNNQEVLKSNESEKERQVTSSEQEVDVHTTSQQENRQAASSNEEEKKHELEVPEEIQQKQEDTDKKVQQDLETQEQENLPLQTEEIGLEGEIHVCDSKKEGEEILKEHVAQSELSKEMEKDAQITDKPGESEAAVVGGVEERQNKERNCNPESVDEESLPTAATSIPSQEHTESSQVVECLPQTVTTNPEVQVDNPTHCEVTQTGDNPEPQQPTEVIVSTDMQTQNDVSESAQTATPANPPKPAPSNSPTHLCLRRSSSSHTSYPTILSEDTFKDPHQSDEQEHTTHTETTKADAVACTENLTQQVQASEAAAVKDAQQSKTRTLQQGGKPKRRGLFQRFRGEASPKATVPKILIQDFSEGEEKLSSKERRRRRREQERREKEEEKERKKREKELEKEKEKEKEKERKKPQTRGKSFQVLSKKSDDSDVGHGNSDSQTIRSKRNSVPHSERYF
ncbi:hypothetical protein NFI96_033975, partial [Prochilodus magdalenae]